MLWAIKKKIVTTTWNFEYPPLKSWASHCWHLDILSTVFFFTCYTINIGTLHCHSLYPGEDLSQRTFNYNPTRIKVGRTVPTHFDRQSKHYLEQSARRGGTSRRRAVEEHPVERWQQRRLVRDVDPVGEERWVAVAGAADAWLEALLLHLRGAMRRRPRRDRLRRDATHQLPQRAARGPPPLHRPTRDNGASSRFLRTDPALTDRCYYWLLLLGIMFCDLR